MYMLRIGGRDSGVVRMSDNAFVPNCEDNIDWQRFLLWESEDPENNVASEYDPEYFE